MRTNFSLTNPSAFSTTDVDLTSPSVLSPVVFRTSFNNFEKINATQAWSLFFTGGKEDKAFGPNPTLGRFLNLGLILMVGLLWTFYSRPF